MIYMTETWVAVRGFEGYEVSDQGQVRSAKSGQVLSPSRSGKPFADGKFQTSVQLRLNGKPKRVLLSRLVADHFIPNPDNLPCVSFLTADRSDHRASNLTWTTLSELSHRRPATSGNRTFRGVYAVGSKFRAVIKFHGKAIMLGTYNTAEEASIAYNEKARELFPNLREEIQPPTSAPA